VKKEIAELMTLWKKDLEAGMHMPAEKFLHDFLAYAHFAAAIKKYTPEIYEEVRGIAIGSGQSFDDIFAFQLMDEYWVYEDKLSSDTMHHHCSAIGIPAKNGKPAYVSQNMDVNSWMDGYQVILHIMPNEKTPGQYVLTCAGIVALNGINDHGIGVCVNTLMELSASTNGLPVAFVIRGILEKKTPAEALSFLKTTKHASGQNYILGTVDSVYDFEASSNNVVRMNSDKDGIVYHTNHPIVNHDVKLWYEKYHQDFKAGKTQNFNSEIRYATLKTRATQSAEKNDLFIKAALRSKDDPNNVICRPHVPNLSYFTFGSVILTLSGIRTMQVTAGPPDESEYQVFSFDK
jgi:predicted choloylglycine hydrolase